MDFSYTSIGDKDLNTSLEQPPPFLKAKSHYLSAQHHHSVVAPRDFHRAHFTWQLPCHTIILRPIATHTSQIGKNDTKISMSSNTTTSPFNALPCVHTIESKHYQPPIGKTPFLENSKTTFSSHSKP
jgi:hypothetical protein